MTNISVVKKKKEFLRSVLKMGLEWDAEEKAQAFLEKAASNDNKVDKKEFEDAVNLFKTATKGKLTDQEIKQRLKKMMEDNAWKAKEGGLFGTKWYSAI